MKVVEGNRYSMKVYGVVAKGRRGRSSKTLVGFGGCSGLLEVANAPSQDQTTLNLGKLCHPLPPGSSSAVQVT